MRAWLLPKRNCEAIRCPIILFSVFTRLLPSGEHCRGGSCPSACCTGRCALVAVKAHVLHMRRSGRMIHARGRTSSLHGCTIYGLRGSLASIADAAPAASAASAACCADTRKVRPRLAHSTADELIEERLQGPAA